MGAWDGYFSLGGVEIANLERFLTYAQNVGPNVPLVEGGLEEVAGLASVFGDNPYTTPVDDRAPWVDVDDPVTHGFLGMRILSMSGIDSSTRSATTTESLSKGGTVGDDREGSREIRFTGLLAGLTPDSVQAGLTWLGKTLWERQRTARQIVPQLPGQSDLRFFEQQPDRLGQIVNRVSNPEATGLGESLVGTAGTAYAFRALVNDDWAYKIIARTDAAAEAQLLPVERAAAVPGQQWMAHAVLFRDSAVLGERILRLFLRFRDQYGNIIESVGKDDTSVPEGELYRWTDARYDSTSQWLTGKGMTTNWVVNPSAEGKLLGVGQYGSNGSRTSLIAFTGFQGKRAYQVKANVTSTSTVATPVAPASAGEQWWARARAAVTSAWGARHFRADLSFVDSFGRELLRSAGATVDRVPAGTVRRWLGTRFQSRSQEITGDSSRINYNPNPIPRRDLYGYSGGGGAEIALERFTGLGTPNAIRVTCKGTPQAGLDIDFTPPAAGTTVYVTFWAIGIPNLALTGRGFTDLAGTANPATGIPVTIQSARPTKVTVGIKITNTSDFLLRLGRRAGQADGYFRVVRIGIMSDNLGYFDGDTGTFEWENPNDQYTSAIAHLPGDYDLYDGLWNASFTRGVGRWSASGMTLGWNRASKRLTTTSAAAQADGKVLAAHDEWPYIAGGQRVSGAMKVYNGAATAVSVAARIRSSTGMDFDGPTVVVPANGSAWVAAPHATMPATTDGAGLRLVAKGAIPAGAVLQIDSAWMGTIPSDATPTEAMWFDGDTASTSGARFNPAAFEFSAGGVAPEGTAGVRLLLHRLGQGATDVTDTYVFDQALLAQFDAVGTAVGDGAAAPVPTMPPYFDGDFPSTYLTVPAAVAATGAPGQADTSAYELTLSAEAPPGAVTAEIAVQRDVDGAAATDVFYADQLMLAEFAPESGVPAYTTVTRQSVASSTERHFQDVRPTAGPTVIDSWTLGPGGCNGAAATIEFTLVAENPTRLHDRGTVVELPLPTDIVQGDAGAGSFAKLEDRAGIVKNYMPQFPPYSGQVPASWVTTATAGSVTAAGRKANTVSPYYLAVTQGSATSIGKTTISALNALGAAGGYDSATASVWVGGTVLGKTITVSATTYSGSAPLNTVSKTVTVADTSTSIFDDAHRVDLVLPDAGGAADGFAISVTTSAGFGTAFIGNPQVTLGSSPFPQINAALPDDGRYTFDTDGSGYAMRVPVAQIESHTIFPNKTAPPVPIATLGGYDEVGLTTYRAFVGLPAEIVPRNATAVPVARVDFDRFISRWVRFRFYPNPLNLAPEDIPTWSYEHEWVIDQFNGNTDQYGQAGYMSIVIDGVSERVWLRAWDGTVLPGDQYVVTSDGGPIGWPELRDTPWVVSVDYPTFRQSSSAPVGDGWWRASMGLMIEE